MPDVVAGTALACRHTNTVADLLYSIVHGHTIRIVLVHICWVWLLKDGEVGRPVLTVRRTGLLEELVLRSNPSGGVTLGTL